MTSVLAPVLAFGVAACTRVVESAPPSSSADAWQASATSEPSAEPSAEAPPTRGRPRLSQTVTLGHESAYSPAPAPAATGGQNVVVNQNVIVQGGYPAYPAYGGLYGGRGYGYGVARPDARAGVGRAGGPSTWSTTGWEGPSRTAAPGQTPGVGGNWSPPPSYGPAQMK